MRPCYISLKDFEIFYMLFTKEFFRLFDLRLVPWEFYDIRIPVIMYTRTACPIKTMYIVYSNFLWLRVSWCHSLSLYCNFRNRPQEAKLFKWRVKLMSTIKVAPFIFTTHSATKGHLTYKHIQGLKWSYKLCLCEFVWVWVSLFCQIQPVVKSAVCSDDSCASSHSDMHMDRTFLWDYWTRIYQQADFIKKLDKGDVCKISPVLCMWLWYASVKWSLEKISHI